MVAHLHNSFRSILLRIISFSRSPQHHSPPHIILLRHLLFSSPPAHPMSSSIFSSPGHSICIRKAHVSLFLLPPNTHRSSSSFHSFRTSYRQATSSDHLISLSLPHFHLRISHLLVDFSLVHTVVLSHSYRHYLSTISCHTHGFSPQNSSFTHLYHILHSKHSHSFLMNIPTLVANSPATTDETYHKHDCILPTIYTYIQPPSCMLF